MSAIMDRRLSQCLCDGALPAVLLRTITHSFSSSIHWRANFQNRLNKWQLCLPKYLQVYFFFFYILDIIDAVCCTFHSCTLSEGIKWELRCAESLFSKVCHCSSEQMFPNSFECAAECSRMFPRRAHFLSKCRCT